MAKKIKISDAAKDLNISAQEIVDFFAAKGDTKKKTSSGLTEEEMNCLLENHTKANEVSSFDEYFASKNDPKPEKKTELKSKPKQEKKMKQDSKKERSEKSTKAKSAPKKEEKISEQPVKKQNAAAEEAKKPAPAAEAKAEKPAVPKKTDDAKNTAAEVKTNAPKNTEKKPDKKKKKEKEQPKARDRGESTKLNTTFSSETASTATQRRTVDTRGSYIDLDKYNERYDQMASGSSRKHGGDNYSSKKQKINQKSAQRNRQQFSRKESEAEKLKRLELERARKQQLNDPRFHHGRRTCGAS